MTHPAISTEDISYRKRISILDTNMAYVDVGEETRSSSYTAIPLRLIFGGIVCRSHCRLDDVSPRTMLAWGIPGPLRWLLSIYRSPPLPRRLVRRAATHKKYYSGRARLGISAWILLGSTPSTENQGHRLHEKEIVRPFLSWDEVAGCNARILQGATHARRRGLDPSKKSFYRISPAAPRHFQ